MADQATSRSYLGGFTTWYEQMQRGWDQFWFRPRAAHSLSLMRVITGLMLCYNHIVLSTQLEAFLGSNAWINPDVSRAMAEQSFAWSFLWYVESPLVLWSIQFLALAVFTLFTVGWKTRPISVLTWFITISYCHRLQGALFGFDQVLVLLTMYLMIAPCGMAYSVDAFLLARREGSEPRAAGKSRTTTVSANVATRLLQCHLCIIYLFGGLAKVRGESWWDGSAMWNVLANLEYQSLDLTFLGRAPWLLAIMALVTIFWETFYCALVWPRWSRPLVLGLAVLIHGGIGLALGMATFAIAMITLNLCFIEPHTVERFLRSGIQRIRRLTNRT